MAGFVKGDVVVVPFPFSDLTQAKRRPAFVLAVAGAEDLILLQITSQTVRDEWAIALSDVDFADGSLKRASNVRPNRIFTADRRLILYDVGRLRTEVIQRVTGAVIELVTR